MIRQEITSAYEVQANPVTATRILYHSRTSTPAGGWPVVADAHGTSGIGRDCAPSLMRDLYHGNQMLQFVRRGWAVVAPDYARMGTTGKVEFVNAGPPARARLSGRRDRLTGD